MSNWDIWKEKKQEYHPNFERRALYRKRRVKYTCEHCGAKQGDERISRKGRPYKVVVAAAHVNHDPKNPRAKLIILCQACHLRYDAIEHSRKRRSAEKQAKRDAAIIAGQRELPVTSKSSLSKTFPESHRTRGVIPQQHKKRETQE